MREIKTDVDSSVLDKLVSTFEKLLENRKGGENFRRGQPRGVRGPCFNCDGKGHFANQCKEEKATCRFCKRQGHLEKFCRDKADQLKASTMEEGNAN